MGLNARDIPLHLLTVLQVSVEKSYNSIKKHPRIWGVLLILFTLYIFFSCIYNLLVFLSPFLVCTAIFVGIFWSSEKTNIKCVEKKKDEKKVERKFPPKVVTNERRAMLYKFPSQNATSRRRNFTGKKLDVYGDFEQKAKNLSAVFHNEFTNKNTDITEFRYLEKEIDSLGYKLTANKIEAPTKKVPSRVDLVTYGASYLAQEKKRENIEEEKKAQEDSSTKVVELKEDDQKNQMDLGICEAETNRRLESLIARRRARKQLRVQIENGLLDLEYVTPSQIAPLFIARLNPFDSPRYFDGIEMPGSAPSGLRSPFDIPYEPFEEKPNLKWDSFDQELTKYLPLERRLDLDVIDSSLANKSVHRHSGKRNHYIPEQLISEESSEIEQAPSALREGEETTEEEERKFKIDIIFKESTESEKAPSALREGDETTHEEERKCKIDMAGMKGEEVDNADPTSYMPDNASEPNLNPTITNVERVIDAPKLDEEVLNFPISNATVTDINDSLYESLSTPVEKKRENMFISTTDRQISHTPSCSLASDLQVEVSEIGSPTLTIDESNETNTSTDGEYDGDVDKDVNSGSEDMWGASLHTREVRGISEHDIIEANNMREIANSSIPLQNIDEENAADVSSMSSNTDMLDDTPTYAMSNDYKIFGNVRETSASKPYRYSSHVLARWKRLMKLMDTRANHLPHENISEKPEDCNQEEKLINSSQVTNDVNNSTDIEQDNTECLRSNEESGASVSQYETINEVSTNSSSSSSSLLSPRSVLPIPQKTVEDQEIHLDVEQSDMEDVAQETVNSDSIPQNIQPSMSDPNVESHNSHSQEQTYPLENFILESNLSRNMNDAEISNKEDQMLKNDENIEDQFSPRSRQGDGSAEQRSVAEMTTSQDMNEESRELFENKVPLISLKLESSSEIHTENEENTEASSREDAIKESCINVEATDTSTTKDFKAIHESLNERLAILSSCISAGESDKLSESHSSNEVNYFQSELKEEVRDLKEREQLDQGDMCEDSPLPMVTEVTNADKINKNEATEQELNENNQTIVLSEPAGESDKVKNIAHLSDDT